MRLRRALVALLLLAELYDFGTDVDVTPPA